MSAFARALPLTVVGALLISGCAGYGPGALKPGDTTAQAVTLMGEPTNRYPAPTTGERLEFARGPAGVHTYMVDVDRGGRITAIDQVLDERHFMALTPGMSREQVRYAIGRPASTMRIARQGLDIWNYRYANSFCQWFQVSMDIDTGRLREMGYGPDPVCDDDERFSPMSRFMR